MPKGTKIWVLSVRVACKTMSLWVPWYRRQCKFNSP